MKHLVRFALVALVLAVGVPRSRANCFYPHSRHIDYYQPHSICYWDSNLHAWACSNWWSLDGTCDIDCDGNMTCDGDTHVGTGTQTQTTLGPCAPICD